MAQNTSNAVMASRVEPNDSLDYFPTPAWATRALCERLLEYGLTLADQHVLEPACGEGHMARPLGEYFGRVTASDVHDYGYGAVEDYLFAPAQIVDWTITNPPFRLASEFIQRGTAYSRGGVAMLVRTSFLEGGKRHRELFSPNPPALILQFCERVPMFKGRIDRAGSTATSYCWMVWRPARGLTSFEWIAPCRKRLERDSDYPEAA